MSKRKWSRAKQIELERPPDPLVGWQCPTCKVKRTSIWVDVDFTIGGVRRRVRVYHCLTCRGCSHCGAIRQVIEDRDDPELVRQPVILYGRPIQGDWECLQCSQLLVNWSAWRRARLRWNLTARSRQEGYRRPEERRILEETREEGAA